MILKMWHSHKCKTFFVCVFFAQMVELLNKTLVCLFFFCKFYAKILIYIHNYHSPHAQGVYVESPTSNTPPLSSEETHKSFFSSYWNNPEQLSVEQCKRFSFLLLFKLKRKKKCRFFCSVCPFPFLSLPASQHYQIIAWLPEAPCNFKCRKLYFFSFFISSPQGFAM